MTYIFCVRSILDGASKYYVSSPYGGDIGKIVSFFTDEGEEFAVIEHYSFQYDSVLSEMLAYMGEKIYPANTLYGVEYRRNNDAGTS